MLIDEASAFAILPSSYNVENLAQLYRNLCKFHQKCFISEYLKYIIFGRNVSGFWTCKCSVSSATTSFNRSLGSALVAVEVFKRKYSDVDVILKSLSLIQKKKYLIEAQVIARLISQGSELSTHIFPTKNNSLPKVCFGLGKLG